MSDTMSWIVKHYGPLVGSKIVKLAVRHEYHGGEPTVGLCLERDHLATTVWILQDPEGNGPGHLEIEKWVKA